MSHFSTKTIYKDLTEIMFLDWWILFSTDTDLINLTVRRTLGVTSEKKPRRFKDIYQIGEGGSSSNQKFKMILISDIF